MNVPSVLLSAVAITSAAAGLSDYDRGRPLDIRVVKSERRAGVRVRDITFTGAGGERIAAYLVLPGAGVEKRAGMLFVHWYEPASPDSNRTQFLPEALELAKLGTVSLLPATMWSEPKWFPKRRREDDLENSIAQLNDLRRALDLVIGQVGPGKPVAYAGHDFGAMFGAVIAAVDRRPIAYALQAGTSRFSHWYLYGPQMAEPERAQFIEKLKAIDPLTHIGKAAPAPVLLQFGTSDKHVPKARADEFREAASEPKKILWYEAGHGLNEQARKDRIEWLKLQLGLSSRKSD